MALLLRYSCLLVFLWCCLAGTQAQAQTFYRMRGHVLHAKTREPLPSVTLLRTRDLRGTITDASGRFLIAILPGDTLLVRSVGFKPLYYVVHKQITADLTTDILLEEGALELPEVKVVGGLDYEKVNRALRNMKKPAQPKVAVRPPAPKPLFEEKERQPPPPPTLESPISFLYDTFSKEGKERRRLQALLEAEARMKKEIEEKKKQQAYDSLFLDRNKPLRRERE